MSTLLSLIYQSTTVGTNVIQTLIPTSLSTLVKTQSIPTDVVSVIGNFVTDLSDTHALLEAFEIPDTVASKYFCSKHTR